MNFLIIAAAQYLYLVILALALLFFIRLPAARRLSAIGLTAIALPVCYLLAQIAGLVFNNPRPFVVDGTPPLIQHAATNGFPSDHTLLTMSVAAVVFVFNQKVGVFFGMLALLVGLARVLARVHYPVDILGSVVIAAVGVPLAVLVWQAVGRRRLGSGKVAPRSFGEEPD